MASTSSGPVRIAHGFGNSRRRLSRALSGPVDLIETDVWFQDGKMVVRHERKLGPLSLLIDERTSLHIGSEHGWRLPLWRWFIALERNPLALQEVLAEAKDKRGLLLDLKGEYGDREEALAQALAEMLERMGMEEQVTICGLNWPLLGHLRAAAPHLKVHYSIGSADQLRAFQAMLERDPIRRICLNHSLAEEPLIERLKGLGMIIYTWAVDDLRRARELLGLGIDGIISNSLEMLGLLDA
ncbi:MAG: glycerophosphodiester phosphodiesterase, partial [Dehalococcoidia bacterium]|nr:glycerophosphodiester phosphodiesterase [Dehalococcoidia bacterium]